MRGGRGGRAERGPAGQGGRGEAAAHCAAARGHHGGARERVLSDGFGAAGQGDPADRRDRAADPGRRGRGADSGAGPQPGSGQAGARHRGEAEFPGSAGPGGEAGRRGRATGELADLAERAAAEAWRLLANARRALRRAAAKAAALAAAGLRDPAAGRRRGRLRRAVSDLAQLLEVTRQVAAQTRQRLAGTMPDGATRRVSLHEPDARPIAEGRLGRPVEFGYKAQVTGNDDGIGLDYAVEQGNPADGPQLAPAIGRVIKRTGKAPWTVTADRSYGEKPIEDDLRALGVRRVAIPRKGKPGKARQAAERRPAFRRAVKWRTGSEGRISALKRQYGWDRTRLDGTQGARTWAGYGILAHNLVKISTLAS